MSPGQKIFASQLAGDFVLPKQEDKKLVFLAGGIGITPFRSMIKYLNDKGEKRDIVLLFSNKSPSDVVYREIFDEAKYRLDMRTNYITGIISRETISKEVPDYKERYFYISGPHAMVSAFEKTLGEMGVPKSHIKIDFFPGFV
jgi:ferredoxin-NADP reductase